MTLKLPCNQCGVNIEHEDWMAGTVVTCPSCGEKTRLCFEIDRPCPKNKKPFSWLKVFFFTTGSLLAIEAILIVAFYVKSHDDLLQGISSFLGQMVIAVAGLLILLLVAMWIIFPVTVFFQLTQANSLLEQISRQIRERGKQPAPAQKLPDDQSR